MLLNYDVLRLFFCFEGEVSKEIEQDFFKTLDKRTRLNSYSQGLVIHRVWLLTLINRDLLWFIPLQCLPLFF